MVSKKKADATVYISLLQEKKSIKNIVGGSSRRGAVVNESD